MSTGYEVTEVAARELALMAEGAEEAPAKMEGDGEIGQGGDSPMSQSMLNQDLGLITTFSCQNGFYWKCIRNMGSDALLSFEC